MVLVMGVGGFVGVVVIVGASKRPTKSLAARSTGAAAQNYCLYIQ